MFDISFIELLVIFVVALVVLGPDKLPGAVRTAALWVGRAKRSFSKAKAEIEQQINADDIRRQLHNESILADIEKARKNADNVLKDTKKELDRTRDSVNRSLSDTSPAPVPVVTSSAEEGAPTGAESWPVKHDNTQSPGADTHAASATAPDVASDPARETAAEAPMNTKENKSQVQDVYNTPPTGRVTVTGRKLAAVNEPQPAADATTKKD